MSERDWKARVERLREIVRVITEPVPVGMSWDRRIALEMTMRIPAEPNRDADLVISWAADEIERLQEDLAEARCAVVAAVRAERMRLCVLDHQALNDALDNLVHDNYELSYSGYLNRMADAGMIRAALVRAAGIDSTEGDGA